MDCGVECKQPDLMGGSCPQPKRKDQHLEKKKDTELFKTLTEIKYLPGKDRMSSGEVIYNLF